MSENTLDAQESDQQANSVPGRKRLGLILTLLALAGAGAGGAWYAGLFSSAHGASSGPGAEGQAAESTPPLYYELASNLVVNFRGKGSARYLQVSIELMTHDADLVKLLEADDPVIKNDLIMLLSDQSYEDLSTRDGKQRLQEAALTDIQSLMRERHGKEGIEALYFTSFVMQ